MFEISFILTLSLFIGTSVLSILAMQADNAKYYNQSKILLFLSIISFLFLGFAKYYPLYSGSFIQLLLGIWSYFYLSTLILILIILYLYFSKWRNKLNSFVALSSPFISIILLISIPFMYSTRKIVIDPGQGVFTNHILPAHVMITIIAQLLFFSSFAGSILYLVMEKQLRKKTSMKIIYQLPSLETIEKFNKWAISRSFMLMSVGIIIGIIITFTKYDNIFLGTAKEIHIYFSWVIILGIYILRKKIKMASHKISIINISLFLIIMFLFIFTNIFITKGFHSFI